MTRSFWFIIGICALALGAIGIVLPLLPTTPFIILSAFAFGKSSPSFRAWLVRNKVFGPMIADWEANGAIAPRYKMIATTMMVGAFALSVWMGVKPIVLVIQAIVLIAAASYVLSRPNR